MAHSADRFGTRCIHAGQSPEATVRSEGGRIAVRNIRRDALHDIKELLKEKMIGEDDEHRAHDEIQVITDKHVASIDKILEQKESELMEV